MALTTKQMSQIQTLLTLAERDDFNKIADMFNTSRRMADNSIKNKFAVGQKVSWHGKRGFLNGKITKRYKLKLDVGYSSLQQLYSWNNKSGKSLNSAPFVGVSFNYNFGKSVFGNFMVKLPLKRLYNSIGFSVPPLERTFSLNFVATSLLKIPASKKYSKASASRTSAHL